MKFLCGEFYAMSFRIVTTVWAHMSCASCQRCSQVLLDLTKHTRSSRFIECFIGARGTDDAAKQEKWTPLKTAACRSVTRSIMTRLCHSQTPVHFLQANSESTKTCWWIVIQWAQRNTSCDIGRTGNHKPFIHDICEYEARINLGPAFEITHCWIARNTSNALSYE